MKFTLALGLLAGSMLLLAAQPAKAGTGTTWSQWPTWYNTTQADPAYTYPQQTTYSTQTNTPKSVTPPYTTQSGNGTYFQFPAQPNGYMYNIADGASPKGTTVPAPTPSTYTYVVPSNGSTTTVVPNGSTSGQQPITIEVSPSQTDSGTTLPQAGINPVFGSAIMSGIVAIGYTLRTYMRHKKRMLASLLR